MLQPKIKRIQVQINLKHSKKLKEFQILIVFTFQYSEKEEGIQT